MSSDSRASYWLHWRSASGAEVYETETEPDRFNFLSFLATAQALDIEFLPIAWDASGAIGAGGSSMIHQTGVNLNTSFAFKTYRKQHKTEEQIFRTLIAEITILGQPFIREHANIVQLQGICWDISPDDDKPWPVLVFEKSHLGDLYHFARHGGQDMTLEDRLALCADVGRAIIDMHCNLIVHGDLKPENVLVFKDNAKKYSARVIDFGYSTRYAYEEQPLSLPRSEPWNAPENNGRVHRWASSQAVKADLFCFGILCVWLLFEPRLCGTAALSQSLEGSKETLRWMKGDFLACAQHLLESETALRDDMKMSISGFFNSSLRQDPEEREIRSIQQFISKLDPQWENGQETASTTSEISISSGEFQINESIYEFYQCDYRVRSHIAQCLLQKSSQSAALSLQTAFCYCVGFGVTRDKSKAQEVLDRSHHGMQTIQDIITYPHQKSGAFKTSLLSDPTIREQIRWSDFSYIYLEQGRVGEAEARLAQDMDNLTSIYATDHPLTLLSRGRLAALYKLQGRWEEAELLEVLVMETQKAKLGEDDHSTLTSIGNLASTYRNQGRWEEAEKLEVLVLETRKVKLGEDHSSTLTCMANLASTFWSQGRWEEAEKLDIQVLESRSTKLGEDHPSTLTSMANLASTYRNHGRWEEAEKLEVQVLETRKIKLGEDHPLTLNSMANLASTLSDQGRWGEAEKLDIQVLESRSTKLGEDHPDTRTSMANLASTYRNQGLWAEAEKLEVQMLEICEKKLTDNHPDMLANMANLASTYMSQGRWEEAEKLWVQVMERRRTKFGEGHPSTLTSMGNLATTYTSQGRWEEAEKLEVQVVEMSKTKLGEDHPETLTSMGNLALTYWKQGRWGEAEKLEVQVMETRKIKLGEDHPQTLTSMSNLAFTFQKLGRLDAALELMRACVSRSRRVLGTEHPDTKSYVEEMDDWERYNEPLQL